MPRFAFLVLAVAVPILAFSPMSLEAQVKVRSGSPAEGPNVLQYPATFEFPISYEELPDWSTEEIADYRFAGHTDVQIESFRTTYKAPKLRGRFVFLLDKGKDKEIALLVEVLDGDGEVVASKRGYASMDEGERSRKAVRFPPLGELDAKKIKSIRVVVEDISFD